jgi:hypothetical protein
MPAASPPDDGKIRNLSGSPTAGLTSSMIQNPSASISIAARQEPVTRIEPKGLRSIGHWLNQALNVGTTDIACSLSAV